MNKVEKFFDQYSESYDVKLIKKYFDSNYRWIIESVQGKNFDSIIDIGCGTGNLLKLLGGFNKKAKLYGLDISSKMVDRAKENVPDAYIVKGDAHKLPFENNSFSLIVNTASFHHYEHSEIAIKEMFRVLEPGGTLLILDSIRGFPSLLTYYWDFIDSKKCYSVHLHKNEFLKLFQQAGFKAIESNKKYKCLPVVHLLIKGEKI